MATSKKSFVRWIIIGLLFIAITFNYADRVIWVATEPAFSHAFGWTTSVSSYSKTPSAIENVGLILFIWSLAYAIFNFPGGWIADKLGLRKTLTTMFAIWSIFTALTAATFNFISMAIVRAVMGAGEGPVWPINSKLTKNWSNKGDESKAFTFAGTGQAVGPVVALLTTAAIYPVVGWRGLFVIFGLIGLIFAAIWYFYVRDTPSQHPGVNKAEIAYINEGKSLHEKEEKSPLSSRAIWSITGKVIFGTQAGWGVFIVFLSFGYILFTMLYWLPPYFFGTFAHTITGSSLYTAAVDTALILGYFGSGPFNDWLGRKFEKVTARRIGAISPMIIMLLAFIFSYYTGTAHLLVPTILLLALASGVMNLTVGSWAVNAVDLAPSGTSATVYGVCNGALNVVGAFNSLIVAAIFVHLSPQIGIVSAAIPMIVFIIGYLVLIRKSTWAGAIKYGEALLKQELSKVSK
ncbi:MAG: MFS transporter [Candidatus Micrarchaeaceae archaeon]